MRTLRRYLAAEIMVATALVVVALVMLFSFFDLVEEMKDLGQSLYREISVRSDPGVSGRHG